MSTGKRLFRYAALYKKTLIAALLMLTVAVGAELTGPFIAKKMIDDHILGIEKTWYETEKGEQTTAYNGSFYKREDYFEPGEEKGKEVHILQVQRDYYFIPGELQFDGERNADGNTVTIAKGEQSESYQGTKLSSKELFAFYEPEIGGC